MYADFARRAREIQKGEILSPTDKKALDGVFDTYSTFATVPTLEVVKHGIVFFDVPHKNILAAIDLQGRPENDCLRAGLRYILEKMKESTTEYKIVCDVFDDFSAFIMHEKKPGTGYKHEELFVRTKLTGNKFYTYQVTAPTPAPTSGTA